MSDTESKSHVSMKDILIHQVSAEIDKSKKDALKAKLKTLIQKKDEANKAVSLIDLEISKLFEDYESGV